MSTALNGQKITTGSGAPAGFYQAVPLATDLGEIDTVVGADGRMLLVAIDANGVRGGSGRVDVGGGFKVTQPGSYEYRGLVNGSSQNVQGVYAPASGPQVSFAAAATPTAADRLGNIATRGLAGTGARVLTAGFVITGSSPKDVLIRAVGPALTNLGVSGALPNPKLRLFKGSVALMENDDWGLGGFASQIVEASARVGAFALPSGSADAAIIARLDPGGYTAQITGEGDSSGVALVEVYDTSSASAAGPKLVNLSTRGDVGRNGDILIAGVVVSGATPKKLLIRGVGPTLGDFGVQGALADPKLQLYQGQALIRENDNWSDSTDAASIATAASAVGAFALPSGSKDAVLLLYLAPGNYTAQVSGAGGTTGIALVEVYEIP